MREQGSAAQELVSFEKHRVLTSCLIESEKEQVTLTSVLRLTVVPNHSGLGEGDSNKRSAGSNPTGSR